MVGNAGTVLPMQGFLDEPCKGPNLVRLNWSESFHLDCRLEFRESSIP